MALSVLQIPPYGPYVLYDSVSGKALLEGNEDELYEWKHLMENAEQQASNRVWMDQLREERLKLLVDCGCTQERAEAFLRDKMPYLFQ